MFDNTERNIKIRLQCLELVTRAKDTYIGVKELLEDTKKIEDYIKSGQIEKEDV